MKKFSDIQYESKQLIINGQYHNALDLLKQYTKNHLFTLSQQNIINKQIIELEKFIQNNLKMVELEKASKDELFNIFINNYDFLILEKICEKFKNNITEADFAKLQILLLDEKIENEIKINYLNILKDFAIQHDFKFFNNKINKTFIINPQNNFGIENYDFIFKLKDNLEVMFFKDVGKTQIAIQIVNKIYCYFFNCFELIKYDLTVLINHITNFIEYSFNNTYKVDKTFLAWIKQILNN